MSKVIVLIDGFNLYHALDFNRVKANPKINPHRYRKYKWLDLWRLANSYVYDKNDSLTGVIYFTTYAYWDSTKVAKHKDYVNALESKGVEVVFGEFKEKDKFCPRCKGMFKTHEEKQTDVNIAIMLLKLAVEDAYDKAIIISGDTDLIPAVKAVKALYQEKQVGVVVPIGKISEDFKKQADFHHKMKEDHLKTSLLPENVALPDGTVVTCPTKWK